MVKQKITPISKGEWRDLKIRKETARKLNQIKLDNDLLTYDDAIQLLINERLQK